jgi:hypothetical protein
MKSRRAHIAVPLQAAHAKLSQGLWLDYGAVTSTPYGVYAYAATTADAIAMLVE